MEENLLDEVKAELVIGTEAYKNVDFTFERNIEDIIDNVMQIVDILGRKFYVDESPCVSDNKIVINLSC